MLWKKSWKNKENETSQTRYFVERDRNRREMAKKMKQTDFTGKKRNDYEKEKKQGDTRKEKKTKKKRPNKKKLKKNEQKWWKRRR